MKTLRHLPALLVLCACSIVGLNGQTVTWTGGSGTPVTVGDLDHYYVTLPANWNSALATDGSADVLFSDSAEFRGIYIPYIAPDVIGLHNISFDSTSLAFSFRGNGDGSYLVLGGNLSATDYSSAAFNSDLDIDLSPGSHTADVGSNGTITIKSHIADYSTASSIYKTGSGTLELSGYNSFTGGVSMDNGWLLVGHDNALGSGTLTLSGGTIAPVSNVTLANAVSITNGIKLGDCDTTSPITFSGVITGSGAFDTHGYGDITFSGNNSGWTGGISFYGANDVHVNHANALGTGAVHFDYSSDTVLDIASGINASIGTLSGGDYEYDSGIQLNNLAGLTINQTSAGQFDGTISGYNDGTTDAGITKNGSATLTLSGNGSYYGPTVINAGSIVADGDHSNHQLGYGAVTINSGASLVLNDTYLINSTVSVESGGTLKGSGTVGDNNGKITTVKSGGTLSPGTVGAAVIGQLSFDDLVLQSGAIYEWNLKNPTGLAGADWDLASITTYSATLHIDSTPGSRLTLKLISVDSAGNPGTATNFNYQSYTWTIFDGGDVPIQYANGTFDPTLFSIDSSAFTTNLPGGVFSLAENLEYHTIELTFTPVPEPSTYALMALGLAGSGLAAWRKRRKAA